MPCYKTTVFNGFVSFSGHEPMDDGPVIVTGSNTTLVMVSGALLLEIIDVHVPLLTVRTG